MSRIARTGNPFMVTLRRRLLARAAAAAVALTGFPLHPVFAQDIVVSGGAVQSNSSPATYHTLVVSGTDGSGNPSTYNADAPLTLYNLLAKNSGVFNANADVSLDNASAYDTGIINLNTGTLSAFRGLSFSGVDSVTRSAGNYSTNSLSLWDGATLGYGSGDSITSSVYIASGAALTLAKDLNLSGYITVEDAATTLTLAGHALSVDALLVSRNATVTLDQNLTLSSYLDLTNGGSITRTSETISAPFFSVDNATLDLLASDTFSPGSLSYVQNGALVNAPAGTSLGSLIVSGTNGNGDRATFNVNGDATVNGSAQAYSYGVINLNTGTLSASQGLSFDGVGSVTRSAGNYSTIGLTLSNGASLGYDAGDTITSSVSLASGATLTLARDLNVIGGITVDGAATSLISTGQAISAGSLSVNDSAAVTLDQNLTLSGYLNLTNGGSITRTSQTISALAFDVDNATFDLLAGDTFSPGSLSYVLDGAIVNAPAGTSIGSLSVSGTNGNGDRAMFNANGSITLTSAAVSSNGVLNLIAGTLSTPSLSLSGVGSAGQAGGHYDVTDLLLGGGATLAFGLGDSIDSLSVAGAGSLLDAFAPLTLSSLSLSNGGVLYLGAFTGTGTIADWGLRMTGDDTVFLQALIELGLLTAGLSPLSVIFDAGSNMTYVTLVSGAVPEIDPTTAHGAVVLLVGALGLLERRLRRSSGAVTLS